MPYNVGMSKLTVEGYGTFDIPDDKRLVLAIEQDAKVDVLHDCGGKGMSRALLKLSGSLVHDYATISDDSPSPNRASRARRAATSAGIS